MKKTTLIFIVILVLSFTGIYAKIVSSKASVDDSLRFNLLTTDVHNILINVGNAKRSILFVDEIKMKKPDFHNKALSFILNSDLTLYETIVNGNSIVVKEYSDVRADGFEPGLRLQAYSEMKGKTKQYELLFDDTATLPDSLTIRIKYILTVSDSLKFITSDQDMIFIPGNTFWYPRNLNRNENIRLTVKSTDEVEVMLNSTTLPYTQNGYLKISDIKITDLMGNPLDISILKPRLK